MDKNYLPEFYHLLMEAQDAVADVDDFDLRSEDPESMKEWNELLATQRIMSLALVDYCAQNRQDIMFGIGGYEQALTETHEG